MWYTLRGYVPYSYSARIAACSQMSATTLQLSIFGLSLQVVFSLSTTSSPSLAAFKWTYSSRKSNHCTPWHSLASQRRRRSAHPAPSSNPPHHLHGFIRHQRRHRQQQQPPAQHAQAHQLAVSSLAVEPVRLGSLESTRCSPDEVMRLHRE